MPTNYSDQFFVMDPANPPPAGTFLNISVRTLTDQNDDGDIDRFDGDAIDGVDIVNSWPGDTVTVNVAGVGNITYTGITFYLPGGVRVFTPTDGQVLQAGTLVSTTWVNTQGPLLVGDLGPPCFVAGTLIETATGTVEVQALRVGDAVLTRDNGPQPVRWLGLRTLSAGDLSDDPSLRPVRIRSDALAPGVPASDLLVSQQHRVLVRSRIAERMFGAEEILVAAKHLCDLDGIDICADCDGVTYVHILFDRHEVIYSNSAETESLYAGPMVLGSLDRDGVNEVLKLFPDLGLGGAVPPARDLAPGRMGRKLAWRHARNEKPLVT